MNCDRPFWETSYSKTDAATTFNKGKPSWDVIEVLENHLTNGKVLDLGCGDGRNALYAANLGYDVTATDISQSAITKIIKLAAEMNVDVQASVQDMRSFTSDDTFDVIISHGCLHLLIRDEWIKVLNNIKAATIPNGFNIVVVFTNKISPSPDMEPFTKGLFDEDELFDHYADWVIHHKSSHTFEDDHDGGIHHVHAANRIIAQKPANLHVQRNRLARR
jgi:tellurite methyltransferase